jgi:hypothetical protein
MHKGAVVHSTTTKSHHQPVACPWLRPTPLHIHPTRSPIRRATTHHISPTRRGRQVPIRALFRTCSSVSEVGKGGVDPCTGRASACTGGVGGVGVRGGRRVCGMDVGASGVDVGGYRRGWLGICAWGCLGGAHVAQSDPAERRAHVRGRRACGWRGGPRCAPDGLRAVGAWWAVQGC